ncbi:class I adenylate-forming enzyme family protein [Parahaliea mediterranea]|uniref:class I adenylate-forming enzyme family protein n=1 Tax=Parahaliea mediterranea TaxID=651086 RepID=UPI000E2E92CC|nr:AMP-binding protein [Parahaliea mediterranea]
MNLVETIEASAAKYPRKPMLVGEHRQWTYEEALAASWGAAAYLRSLGVNRGDTVCILSLNIPEFVITMIAIWRLGAIVVPVNHKLAPGECAYIFEHSSTKLVLASETLLSTAHASGANVQVVALNGPDSNPDALFAPKTPAGEDHICQVDGETPAEILYTSGTTGKPKGCIHTHHSLRSTAVLSAVAFSMVPTDRTLIAMPIWHAAPLNNFTLSTLFVGGTLVLLPEYDPTVFVTTLEEQQISVFFGSPVSYTLPLHLPGGIVDYSFASIRAFFYGGGPISAELSRELAIAYRSDNFYQVYGMTETGPGGTLLYPQEQQEKAGSIGNAAQPGVDLKLVKEDGSPAAAGEVGEIWIRSDGMMSGYLNAPDATAQAVDGRWYKSGDLARIDDDGYMFIVDRKKDMIITGGENVYSKEVEDALYTIDGVQDCAVIGVPHPEWGETVVAVIVPETPDSLDHSAMRDALTSRLAAYKIPRRIQEMSALPRTPTGKIQKHVIRGLLEEQT